MSTSYYRIQAADRDVADLLVAAEQVSRVWHGNDDQNIQAGVSVCESREALAAYLAIDGAGIPYGTGDWVVVQLSGDLLGYGLDNGELLVRPTAIVSVTEMDDEFYELIGACFDAADAADAA